MIKTKMKKFISMFAFVAALVLGAFSFASCGGDDDDDQNTPNAIITYKIEAYVGMAEPSINRGELETIVKSVTLPTFTAPKNATAEELNEKVIQIVTAANMEAIVKEKAVAAGFVLYTISFKVMGDANQETKVSHRIIYTEIRDGEDIEQLYTMTYPNFQVDLTIPKGALNDLDAISYEYESKLNFTFKGKKEEAFKAMKEYLESDETKGFRDAIQKHIDTYNDADLWYCVFIMIGENKLRTEAYYFGNRRP